MKSATNSQFLLFNYRKPSLEEMWEFIDNMMGPYELVPSKSVLTYEQVSRIYSKFVAIDELFTEFEITIQRKLSIKK